MTSSQDDSEWDKSTSEIQSEDSDELSLTRPNRWRGPPQSWRTLTEEDRLTYTAFERLRNADLSIHLYNAFALRQGSRLLGSPDVLSDKKVGLQHAPKTVHKADASKQDVDAETGQPISTDSWAPPRSWTAWPLRAHLLPPDDFMEQTVDEDSAFTFQRIERDYPSKRLEEVVSAAILGFAKERFRQRRLGEAVAKVETHSKREPLSSDNEVVSGVEDASNEPELNSCDSSDARSRGPRRTTPGRLLQPAVATNDDQSYELIQPSTRSILRKLDQVLTILHNTRMASAQNLFDAVASSSSEDEDFYNEATPSRKSRSRTRSRATSRANTDSSRSRSRSVWEASTDGETLTQAKKKSNRGRKPAVVPREGESERDFLIRRAKQQKKKVPVFSDEEPKEDSETGAENTKEPSQQGRQRHFNQRERRRSAVDREYWQQKRLDRLNLRDWSDVMGAAALAGFSPKVIARATQRCANLFGQGMEMHTIGESTGLAGTNAMETKQYVPGEPIPSSSSESDGEADSIVLRQARSMSRHSSMAPSRAASLETSAEESQDRQSPRKRQKRSTSHGTSTAQHYCPHTDCERAITGFGRQYNLKRHIELAHQGHPAANMKTEEEKGETMYGGVSLDGFLEPIRMRKGWRADDTARRARRLPKKQRPGDETVSEGQNGFFPQEEENAESQA